MGKVVRRIRCPNKNHQDSRPSCCVYDDGGKHCFSCGYHERGENDGTVFTPVRSVESESSRRSQPRHNESLSSTQAETYASWLWGRDSSRLSYLKDRGISESVIRERKLGYTGSAYSIPIFDNGKLVTIRFRSDDEYIDHKMYWGLSGRNQPHFYGPDDLTRIKRLHFVEGELDTLCLESHGYRACTCTGGIKAIEKSFLNELAIRGFRGRLILVGDQDKPGLEAQRNIARRGLVYPLSAVRFNYKDISELYQNEGSTGLIRTLDNSHPLFTKEEINDFFSQTKG